MRTTSCFRKSILSHSKVFILGKKNWRMKTSDDSFELDEVEAALEEEEEI
jgi:hypothetical protein